MAYTKNTWSAGDKVTSAKLNNIEEGICESLPLVVTSEQTGAKEATLGQTWQEVYDAVTARRAVLWAYEVETDADNYAHYVYSNVAVGKQNTTYYVNLNLDDSHLFGSFSTDDPSKKPVMTWN